MNDNHANSRARNPSRRPQHLLRQAAGALAWGIFFSVAPFGFFVVMGALVWMPLLVWRERVRARRYGFYPGALIRFAVVAAVVTTAALLPVKAGDARVRGLPRAEVTLDELAAAGVLWPIHDEGKKSLRVSLPSDTPTRREVKDAIEQQTGFRTRTFNCGTVASVLFGPSMGPIEFPSVSSRGPEPENQP